MKSVNMPNYQNGKIYTIRSHQTENIYIGSTTQPLTKRLSKHKADYKRYNKNNNNKYYSSFKIVKYEDVYIELYELYPCNSNEELHKREGELIRELDCVNKYIAGRTKKEYNEDNKEDIFIKKKQYREDNKEKISIKKKEYRKNNKEKFKQTDKKYYEDNKEKSKQYYQDNKEKMLIKSKQYYQDNSEKITCECGSIIAKYNLKRHKKSKKHINYENSKS
jgi:hypothetical protein